MNKKVILNAAITGAVHIPSMSEYLPIFPDDIIKQGIDAIKAGASTVHVHARDYKDGRPSSDPKIMKYIVDGIRKGTDDSIICVTTGGAVGMSTEERLAALPEVNADLASCNAGSINFEYAGISNIIDKPLYDWEIPHVEKTYDLVFSNTFKAIEDNIIMMQKLNVKPEFEIYDLAMLDNINYFVKKGILTDSIYLQFMLGINGGLPATIENLVLLVHKSKILFEDNFTWSVGASGRHEFDLGTCAVGMGGNVRVGLEDNLYLEKGVLSKSNAESVNKMKSIIEATGRQVATPAETRKILNLK